MTDPLRKLFESQHKCSFNHRRSRRGTYVNPPTARDWKWFQAGAAVAPRNAIGKLLAQAMDEAVRNGANSVSMPDEYVEIALWLSNIEPKLTFGKLAATPQGKLHAPMCNISCGMPAQGCSCGLGSP